MRYIGIVAAFVVSPLLAQTSYRYEITDTYRLGGPGRWDYIVPDAANHRLFIGREDRVMVVDENDGALLGEVTGINGAHGTALAPVSGHGFATSGDDGFVVMFDLNSLHELSRIPAAEDADAIIYDPASNRVFSLNGDAHSATVIDASSGKLITNIALGGKPEYGAATGDGKVFVNLTDNSEIVEIDSGAATVTRRWPTAPCAQPVSMAIDVTHQRLFSGCRGDNPVMAISDYGAGKVIATAPIGRGVDGVGFDPSTGDLFASASEGTLTVLHQDTPDRYSLVETLKTQPGSRNMGLDTSNHRIFVAEAKFSGGTNEAGRGQGTVLADSFALLVIERRPAAQ